MNNNKFKLVNSLGVLAGILMLTDWIFRDATGPKREIDLLKSEMASLILFGAIITINFVFNKKLDPSVFKKILFLFNLVCLLGLIVYTLSWAFRFFLYYECGKNACSF
jgi:hypothetical protein